MKIGYLYQFMMLQHHKSISYIVINYMNEILYK